MRGKLVLILVVMCLLGVGQVHASHWRGIKVTPQTVDSPTLSADISVTVYSAESGPSTTQVGGNSSFPAVAWGDGAKTTTATVAYYGTYAGPAANYVLKGSFSHTYPSAGAYTITAATSAHAETVGYHSMVTGNTATGHYGTAILTNTATVTFAAVPAVPKTGLWLLSGALALGGAGLLLTRRS